MQSLYEIIQARYRKKPTCSGNTGHQTTIRYSTYMDVSPELIQKINSYNPNEAAVMLVRQTPILFLVGIAGAGKDTIKRQLLTQFPNDYHHIVSHTTRPPRENHGRLERNGIDYHFIDMDTAEHMLDARAFIEAKLVHQTDIYGTSVDEIQAAHNEKRVAITDLEVKGVAEYEEISPDVKAVFILPPSYDVWLERLTGRYNGQIDTQELQRRMHTAYHEIAHVLSTEYYYLVVNDDLQVAVNRIQAIAHNEPLERRPEKDLAIAQEMLKKLAQNLTH